MFDNIIKFFKKFSKDEKKDSKDTAKERLHLVLMQDRANVSADFMELMKQEIIEVIKKYINVDENSIDVKLTNKVNSDGTTGAPILYANIPILNVKDDAKQINIERKLEKSENKEEKQSENKDKKTESKVAKKDEEEKTESEKEEVKEEAKQEVKKEIVSDDKAEENKEVAEMTEEEKTEREHIEETTEVIEDSKKEEKVEVE